MKKSRDQSITDNPESTRRKEAEKKKKSRDQNIQDNPVFTRRKNANRQKATYHKSRQKESEHQRRFKFLDAVRDGPIFTCVCCHRIRFRKAVQIFNDITKNEIKEKSKSETILDEAVGDIPSQLLIRNFENGENEAYICTDCLNKMKANKVPSMSHRNNLELFDCNGRDELKLTELENTLVARHILFQMFLQLPKSHWTGVKKQMVSIPIFDIEHTLRSFPRTPDQAALCKVQLKRKLSMKNTHVEQYVSVHKILSALNTFVELDNPHYENIIMPDSYEELVKEQDPIGYEFLFPNNTDNNAEDSTDKEQDEDEDMVDEESLKYMNEDSIQKWKFHQDNKTTYVNDYPEINVNEEGDGNTEDNPLNVPVSVAPGEGKYPENILKVQNWDTGAFPSLHPDGKNGLHEERKYKLTDPDYFH